MSSNRSRRRFLKNTALAGVTCLVSSAAVTALQRTSIVVVGAGAFGGWSALQLLRRGAKVTLIDAWGPGNSRASSGGETRVIRTTYGPARLYTQMAARALQLWQENERRWNLQLLFRTGSLWMAGSDDSFERASLPLLEDASVRFEKLSNADCTRRWPQINFEGIPWAIFEPDSGYLVARRACEAVLNAFLKEGGEYRQISVTAGPIVTSRMHKIAGRDESLKADHFIFACGPWLGSVFPFLAPKMNVTRQEVYFLGTAANDLRFTEVQLPVWIDNGRQLYYGIPGNQWRGFKIADDTRGPVIDPTTMERRISAEGLASARAYLRIRFPGMSGAPLLESRVCQYENSEDQNFILDRHPEAENVWIVGGGSGHGFKHGPVMGEMVADAVLQSKAPPHELGLERLFAANRVGLERALSAGHSPAIQ
jgi:glycine/D-amino acid oxidase-like deaminating enzyme